MQLRKLALLGPLVLFIACQEKPAETTADTATEPVLEASTGVYGDTISAANALPLGEALALLEDQDSVYVKLEAEALSSCPKMGCWMKVNAPGEEEMRVTFRDYGFFVPKDLSGQRVIMEGMLKKKTSTVEELQHYAEDAGKSEAEIAAITEPKAEPTFVANGVLVYQQ